MAKSPLQAGHDHGHDGGHHIHPISMYMKTALFLAVFMVITIWAAFQTFPGGFLTNNLIAIGIASVKCFVVVMYFMHVKWASPLGKLWAFIGFFFLSGLCVILVDYFFRHHEATPTWQAGRAESALPRKIGSQDQAVLDPKESNIQNRIPKASMN
jgi:caa(3)-type oxidase subunit IV